MKKKKAQAGPTTHSEDWRCDTCGVDILDGRKDMIAHLRDVHKMPDKCSATKSTVMCLDGEGFYQNTYEWNWASLGVKATQTCSGPRDPQWG